MLLYVVGRLRKGIASHNLMMMTVLCVDYMISILSLTVIRSEDDLSHSLFQ